MPANEFQIAAAKKWLERRDLSAMLTPEEFASFCNDAGLGFKDAWIVIKATSHAILKDSEFVKDADGRFGGPMPGEVSPETIEKIIDKLNSEDSSNE